MFIYACPYPCWSNTIQKAGKQAKMGSTLKKPLTSCTKEGGYFGAAHSSQ